MKYSIAYFNELYGSGGFYEQFLSKDDLINLEIDNNNRVTLDEIVFDAARYQRTKYRTISSDKDFSETIDVVFRSINDTFEFCPPSLSLQISKCVIYDSAVYIIDDFKFTAFYPSLRSNDFPYISKLESIEDLSSLKTKKLSLGHKVIYLASAGSFNYGHWLIDDLPRLKAVINHHPFPTKLVMQSFGEMDAIRRQSIELLHGDWPIEVEFLRSGEAVECERLTYISPVSFHPYIKNPNAICYLRDHIRASRRKNIVGREKIFVRRGKGRNRQVENEVIIEQLLIKEGFVCIDPEKTSFSDQVDLFANATVVVGIMCAAMCNTIVCRENTKIILLAPSGWIEPFYWDLAGCLDHEYIALYGERSHRHELAHFDDFTIDPTALQAALHEIH